jgi:hypothetical protein
LANVHEVHPQNGGAQVKGMIWRSSLVIVVLGCTSIAGFTQTEDRSPKPVTFGVPQDLALRIRLDDTLTSKYSEVGDPFSATVVDKGPYEGARVYGEVASIEQSGRIRGNTTMMLKFRRIVMPDGRRTPISAEIVRLYHAPSGESVDVEGAIESGGRGRKSVEHTTIGAGAGALLGAIFGGGKGAGIGSIIGGAGGLGTTAFSGPQDVVLERGLEMLIQITGG